MMRYSAFFSVALILGLGFPYESIASIPGKIADEESPAENAADRCEAADGFEWAFARVSPVSASKDAERRGPTRLLNVRFADAYAVLNRSDASVKLCIDGQAKWFSRADFSLTANRRWIAATNAMRNIDRPRLEFWRSLERLMIYFGREKDVPVGPIYREIPAGRSAERVKLPLIREEAVFTDVGNRVIKVGNVLVPVHRSLIEAYVRIRNAGSEKPGGPLAIVLDISGSAEGFTGPAISNLRTALSGDGSDQAVIMAGFGGDGTIDVRRAKSIHDPNLDGWDVRQAPGFSVGRHDLRRSINAVADAPGKQNTLIVLAGGDISLADTPLGSFSNVVVAQITPERQKILGKSARAEGALFLDFPEMQEGALVSVLDPLLAPTPRIFVDPNDYGELAELAAHAETLALIPADIEAAEQLVHIPPGRDAFDWIALPLWTVVRLDLLTIKEE